MQYSLYKLKKNKVEVWKDWLHQLDTTYRKEAEETLKEEGLVLEFWTVFEANGSFYTLGGDIVQFEGNKSNCEVNRLHDLKKKECFIKRVDIIGVCLKNQNTIF